MLILETKCLIRRIFLYMTVQKINCVQVGQIIQINILHVLLAWMFLSAETNSVIQIRHAIDRRFSGSVYA